MKIRYELQTPWPTDVRNPDRYDAADWEQHGEIPFVPIAGMLIDSGDGDFREVKGVYWRAEEPDQVVVYFEDDEARALDYWTSGGWTTNDLPDESETSNA